jgi:ferritin
MASLSDRMRDVLNDQVHAELYSAYLYLSMAAYFDSQDMHGMARWMRAQFAEEQKHAMKLYDYVVERGGRVTMKAIEGPQIEWPSPLAVFEAVYAHEQKVTGMINGLVAVARQEGDRAAEDFLQWFVKEQEEEEESADGVVQKMKKAGDDPAALKELDAELGRRQG